jgi:hypothetical protein
MLNEIITNQYLYYGAILVLGIYMTVDLPPGLIGLYKNNLFKIIILSIVLTKATNNMISGICLSSAAIFGAEIILSLGFAKIFNKERFQIDTTNGGFKLSGVRQHSTAGQSKVLTISQSSSDQSLSVSESSSSNESR